MTGTVAPPPASKKNPQITQPAMARIRRLEARALLRAAATRRHPHFAPEANRMDFPTLARTAYQMARQAIPGLRFDEQSFHDWAWTQAVDQPALITHAVDLVMAA